MPYPAVMPNSPASAASVTHPFRLRPLDHAHPRAMTRPAKRKRPKSEDAGERIVVSEVMLRNAALTYAAVANLDPFDQRWRRCWRALRLAATGMVATMASSRNAPQRAARLV